ALEEERRGRLVLSGDLGAALRGTNETLASQSPFRAPGLVDQGVASGRDPILDCCDAGDLFRKSRRCAPFRKKNCSSGCKPFAPPCGDPKMLRPRQPCL